MQLQLWVLLTTVGSSTGCHGAALLLVLLTWLQRLLVVVDLLFTGLLLLLELLIWQLVCASWLLPRIWHHCINQPLAVSTSSHRCCFCSCCCSHSFNLHQLQQLLLLHDLLMLPLLLAHILFTLPDSLSSRLQPSSSTGTSSSSSSARRQRRHPSMLLQVLLLHPCLCCLSLPLFIAARHHPLAAPAASPTARSPTLSAARTCCCSGPPTC